MSKWINKEKFENFKNERANDNTEDKGVTFARKWPNPKMGTQNKPNEYHVRLLPDINGDFYKKIFFHMFQSGEKWCYILCPKTHGMDNYCPWCALTQILWQGSESDRKRAGTYKRKEKFVTNIFVVKDPRDANENDEEKQAAGKTFLYEFPATIEQRVKKEMLDTENGWGYDIFNPEKGYNLIISIGAKKPDKSGKVWPDYSLTEFAKRPSAIADSEEDIEEIMKTTQPIKDYLDRSTWSADQHEELLKSEMVYEDIEDGFIRHMKKEEEPSKEEQEPSKEKNKDSTSTSSNSKEELSDEDLLRELENI